jgi:hypothetical protein
MIVERFTYKAKVGETSKLVEMLKDWLEASGLTGRVCSNNNAWGITTLDLEFDTSEDKLKFWADYDFNSQKWQEYWKKFNELRESGTTREEWQVH